MKTLNSLYFPDTTLYSEAQYPPLLLIDKLHYLSPVEQTKNPDLNDIFVEQGFCQVHTPLPLKDDRERFLHLLTDIQSRKDDYRDQLKSLTIAGILAKKAPADEEKTSLVSSLLQDNKINSSQDGLTEKEQAAIWQARLILSLAEILDREEAELAEHLSFWDEQEMQVFRELQGDDEHEEDNPFQELMEIQQKINTPNPAMMTNRCRAWSILAGKEAFKDFPVWLVTREDAAFFLFDAYQKETGTEPYLCDMLNFPVSIGRDFPFVTDSLNKFKNSYSEILSSITEILYNTIALPAATDSPERPIIPANIESEWNKIIDREYPEELYGRKKMKIYFMENFQPAEILSESHFTGNGLLLVF